MINKNQKMKNALISGLLLFTFHVSLFTAYSQMAVKGETVWTMAGEPITNGVVLINNGKIEAVGALQISGVTTFAEMTR